MSLLATLAYLGNNIATNPRDRIYSVLGLITELDRAVVGKPDYASSVEQIYCQLVKGFWKVHKSLEIICFAHIFNRNASNIPPEDRQGTLPTWAPDWRAYFQSSPVPLMASQSASKLIGNFRPLDSRKWNAVYDACGGELRKKAKVRFPKVEEKSQDEEEDVSEPNMKEMWADGVFLDDIVALGGLEGCETRCRSIVCGRDGHSMFQTPLQQTTKQNKTKSDMKLLKAVARSLTLDREDKYFRFHAPKHYVSEFLVLWHTHLNSGEVDTLFVTWFKENNSLNINGRSLLSIIKSTLYSEEHSTFSSLPPSTVPPSSPPSVTAVDTEKDTFLARFHDTIRKKTRRLMVTKKDYIGMAPCRARPGDAVVILFGCSIPLVLRRVGNAETWKVIGEAYVHGFMNGEVARSIKKGKRATKTFRLV